MLSAMNKRRYLTAVSVPVYSPCMWLENGDSKLRSGLSKVVSNTRDMRRIQACLLISFYFKGDAAGAKYSFKSKDS